MVIFRENTEDIYAGIEFEAGTEAAQKFLATSSRRSSRRTSRRSASPRNVRHRHQAGVARRAPSGSSARRSVRRSRPQAQERHLRAQGQHHEVHRRRLPQAGATPWPSASSAARSTPGSSGRRPRRRRAKTRPTPSRRRRSPPGKILIKDAIADITLQQVLTRPDEFDVIATLNLNGDYLSDALAAQVGGIGIAPGGNINYVTGHAVFEATHGTAPKYADQDKVNPGSRDPLRRDDAPPPGLDRGGGPHHQGHGRRHRRARP